MSSIVIPFIGGLAMFIYGMNIMADGLQHAAGSKMKKILEVLTQNKLMGIALGALVTAIIQSSSATTVMVVGFVNAGLMNLTGNQRYHGCEYRYNHHGLVGFRR